MITSLRIANFKAAASVTVPLGPITVLIGPNDSGKSTILQALMALSRAATKLRAAPDQILDCPLAVAVTNQDPANEIEISAEGTAAIAPAQPRAYLYKLSIPVRDRAHPRELIEWDGKRLLEGGMAYSLGEVVNEPSRVVDSAPYRAIANSLSATLLRLDARAIAKPSPLGAPLLDDGSGLVGIVDELLTSGVDDEKIAQVTSAIQRLTPHVKSLAARRHPSSGGKELHFALRSGAVIPASQMSDGVVLATALLLISLCAGTQLLLIEEPENGLHPRQLRIVADTIRALSAEHGTQIVLTTHSPLLLNHFGADEALLVTRTESGVAVRPMSETQGFGELATEMSLGELWYNVGDSHLARPA